MSLIWSDQLKIGIPVIDAQHKSFFDCQKTLVDAYQNDPVGESLGKTLSFLEDYALKHFADEENYMHRNNCSKIEEHIAEHQAFVNKIIEIRQEYQENGVSKNLTWFVDHFLLHWITTHIMSFDQSLKWCPGEESR